MRKKKNVVTADINLVHISKIINGYKSRDELLDLMIGGFPGKDEAVNKELIWYPPQYLYIELHALEDKGDYSGNFEAFKKAICELITIIKENMEQEKLAQ